MDFGKGRVSSWQKRVPEFQNIIYETEKPACLNGMTET